MRMVVAGQKRATHCGAWTCHGVSCVRRECAALAHLQLSASKIKGSDFVDTFCAQKHCGEFILPPGVENLNTIAAVTRHRASACIVHVHALPPRLELQPPNSYPTHCYSISSFNSHRFFLSQASQHMAQTSDTAPESQKSRAGKTYPRRVNKHGSDEEELVGRSLRESCSV